MENKIKIESYIINDNYVYVQFDGFDYNINKTEFEKWLDENNYLQGTDETPIMEGGHLSYKTETWNNTVHDIYDDDCNFDLIELLNEFMNEKLNKELKKIEPRISDIILEHELRINSLRSIVEMGEKKKSDKLLAPNYDKLKLLFTSQFLKYKL